MSRTILQLMGSSIVTSPQCVVYINSIPFARCTSFTYHVNSPVRELHGIDILEPIELVPTVLTVGGNFTMLRLHGDGGAEAAGILATWNKMTKEKYFSITLMDRKIDSILFQCNKAKATSQSWQIQPKSLLIGNIAFSGITYNNEAS
jgi:hypothetical protein